MTANGLPSRRLRARSRSTVTWSRASQTRWKPPRPLSATIWPARIRAPISSSGVSSCGPQVGQHVVSAWKRRSAGLAYSAAQASHKGNSARDVVARSYGRRRVTVKRGPQCVQVMNYTHLRAHETESYLVCRLLLEKKKKKKTKKN